jgi:hypothetical protein
MEYLLMREINSPNTFKTSYIAQVKEENGILSVNRKQKVRKIKVPKHLKPFIEQAIKILRKKTGKIPTYKEIQQKALEIYNKNTKSEKFYGIFKTHNKNYTIQVTQDKETYYE